MKFQNKIPLCIILGILVCIAPVLADSPYVQIYIPGETYGTSYLTELHNTTEFWDNLDDPSYINITDLGDVNESSPLDDEVLSWDDATMQWIARTLTGVTRWLVNETYSGSFIYNDSNTLYFNDTTLNLTIDLRDALYNETDTIYFYNMTDTILFYNMTVLDTTIADTNATTECGANEVLDGDGDCVSHILWITNDTAGWTMNFTKIFTLDWTNFTGVTSQISDWYNYTNTILFYNMTVLDTTIADTNASTECSANEFLGGSGVCVDISGWDQDSSNDLVNNTAGWTVNFTKIFSLDWLNFTGTVSQISDWYNYTNTALFYNMTVLDTTIPDTNDTILIYEMNDSWMTTINATYLGWAYNQTATELFYNMTVLDTTIADTNETTLIYELNASWMTTINATYNLWAYNMTMPPNAAPSDGDTTHFSLADQIYDWAVGLFFTKSAADTAFLNRTGDYMLGDLNVSTNNVTDVDYTKFHGGGYIYDNGTSLILGHS